MSEHHDRPTPSLTYADAGVDIDRANQAKSRIKELARSTFNDAVLSDIGSFGGLYRVPFARYENPVLVSSADGVGTKLKLAFLTGIHDTVGIDLVAHCTNDILVQGALPLFFLDYIACGQMEPGVVEQVVSGLSAGCRQSQCALLGGETAEMPDFYRPGEYDLAGFIVGIAEEGRLLGSSRVEQGDALIGLPSSGLHTNGYSLARKLFFEVEKFSADHFVSDLGQTVGEELLTPHRNYLPILRELIQTDDLHALAHITGGGLPENLNRVMPPDCDARVDRGTWPLPAIFKYIRERGRVADAEMYRTFNMGLGMVLVVAQGRLSRVEEYLQRRGQRYFLVGEVTAGEGKVVLR